MPIILPFSIFLQMHLSASSEKIARWASVSEFPSLNTENDGGGMNGNQNGIMQISMADIVLVPHNQKPEEPEEDIEQQQRMEATAANPPPPPGSPPIQLDATPREGPEAAPAFPSESSFVTTIKEIPTPTETVQTEAMVPPRRSVKDLIQAFSKIEVKNLEVIDEEGEETSSGSWGRKQMAAHGFRKLKS